MLDYLYHSKYFDKIKRQFFVLQWLYKIKISKQILGQGLSTQYFFSKGEKKKKKKRNDHPIYHP